MDGIITTGAIIAVGFSLLVFLLKHEFSRIVGGQDKLAAQMQAYEQKVDERIAELKKGTDEKIGDVEKRLTDLEKDLPLLYVTKDEYIRTMNGVEAKMQQIDAKLDRLLMK